MNTLRLRIGITVSAFLLSIATIPQAVAQNAPIFYRRLIVEPILHHAVKAPGSNAGKTSQARRLALERYQFLKRLKPRFGYVPLRYVAGIAVNALFPVGRADRVYLFFPFWYAKSPTGAAIICYQHNKSRKQKSGKEHLKGLLDPEDHCVYQVNLKAVPASASTTPKIIAQLKRVPNLLGLIGLGSEPPTGNVPQGWMSPLIRNDLTARREYVWYSYNDANRGLDISIEPENLWNFNGKGFYINKDPVTKASLTPDQFFAKYGLPIAKGELTGK